MKLNTHLVRDILLVLILASLVAAVGSAKDTTIAHLIAFSVQSATEDEDALLKGVVERAIEIRFDALGATTSAVAESLQVAKPEKIIRQTDAQFFLSGLYEKKGDQAKVTFSWFDGESSEITATAEKSGKIDIFFDEVIFTALESIIDAVNIELTAAVQNADAIQSASASATNQNAVSGAEATTDGATGLNDPVSPSDAGKGISLQSSVRAGAFIALGKARDYLSIGGGLGADLLYQIQGGQTGTFGFGGEAGALLFSAEGTLASSSNFLFPFGAVMSFQGVVGNALRIAVDFSGGGVFFLTDSSRSGLLYQVIPYGSVGMALDLRFTEKISVGVGSDFDVYVTLPDVIMGVSPALFVRFGM